MNEQEPGICPQCGGDQLDYSDGEYAGETYDYPCTCAKCGYRGREQYYLQFSMFEED